jgi:dihydroorotase
MLEITRPDDWHLHFRDGDRLVDTVAHTATQFARAIVMPNLKPPVTTVAQAAAYRDRIVAATPAGVRFTPLMTLYLTDNSDPSEVQRVKDSGFVVAYKLYPAGATTNSDAGITRMENVSAVLAEMERLQVPLLVHGEVTEHQIDVFDREKAFIDQVMLPTLQRFSKLRVVFEHITTKDAADFVADASYDIGATITAHHLLYNRNAIFQGGIRPHYYCLPILKRELHREALLAAATSGNKKFFLGTDSAPHAIHTKEAACGCAGCYTAHAAIELYAEAFASVNKLNMLEQFASFNGPDFYRLPRNSDKIVIHNESWQVPATYKFGDATVVPLRAGETLHFRAVNR